MAWDLLYERARRRHGVSVRQDAPACGISITAWEERVSEERWERPYLGTRLLPGTTWSPLVRLSAALHSVRAPVAVDRWSAAWLLGVRKNPPKVPMLVVPSNRRPRRRDIVVRRTDAWDVEGIVLCERLPTLGPAKLMADFAALGLERRGLIDLCIRLKLRHGLSVRDLSDAMARYRRFGPRELIDELCALLDAHDGSESGLEYLVRALLMEAGFEPDDLQVEIVTRNGRRRLDIVFRLAMVGIEVQSVEYHGDFDAMTRDAMKLNSFKTEGDWEVLLLTPAMLTGEPWREFCAQLRHLLDTRG